MLNMVVLKCDCSQNKSQGQVLNSDLFLELYHISNVEKLIGKITMIYSKGMTAQLYKKGKTIHWENATQSPSHIWTWASEVQEEPKWKYMGP